MGCLLSSQMTMKAPYLSMGELSCGIGGHFLRCESPLHPDWLYDVLLLNLDFSHLKTGNNNRVLLVPPLPGFAICSLPSSKARSLFCLIFLGITLVTFQGQESSPHCPCSPPSQPQHLHTMGLSAGAQAEGRNHGYLNRRNVVSGVTSI